MDPRIAIKALLFMKGHSERVPGKNLRNLCGRPLFFWILDAIRQSGVITETIINTDSREIANLASSNFDVTIHMRPNYLLEITSNEANQIIAWDLEQTEGEMFLQTHSTNPLLMPESIRNAVEFFLVRRNKYDSLFSVTPARSRFYYEDGTPVNHKPDHLVKTQELTPLYEENSCIYLFTRESFSIHGRRTGKNPVMFPLDPAEAVDIDEPHDFELAECLMRKRMDRI